MCIHQLFLVDECVHYNYPSYDVFVYFVFTLNPLAWYMYMNLYSHINTYVYIHICAYENICIHIRICVVCVRVCLGESVRGCVCACKCVRVCVCVCIDIDMYT